MIVDIAILAALFAFLLTLLVIDAAILFVGWLAYRARRAREEAARERPAWEPDPVTELARLRDETAQELAHARVRLESVRDAFRRGLEG